MRLRSRRPKGYSRWWENCCLPNFSHSAQWRKKRTDSQSDSTTKQHAFPFKSWPHNATHFNRFKWPIKRFWKESLANYRRKSSTLSTITLCVRMRLPQNWRKYGHFNCEWFVKWQSATMTLPLWQRVSQHRYHSTPMTTSWNIHSPKISHINFNVGKMRLFSHEWIHRWTDTTKRRCFLFSSIFFFSICPHSVWFFFLLFLELLLLLCLFFSFQSINDHQITVKMPFERKCHIGVFIGSSHPTHTQIHRHMAANTQNGITLWRVNVSRWLSSFDRKHFWHFNTFFDLQLTIWRWGWCATRSSCGSSYRCGEQHE